MAERHSTFAVFQEDSMRTLSVRRPYALLGLILAAAVAAQPGCDKAGSGAKPDAAWVASKSEIGGSSDGAPFVESGSRIEPMDTRVPITDGVPAAGRRRPASLFDGGDSEEVASAGPRRARDDTATRERADGDRPPDKPESQRLKA